MRGRLHGVRDNHTLVVNTGFFKMSEPDGVVLSDVLRQGRKMAHYVAGFLRKHLPGCEDSFVLATANAPGLRRSCSSRARRQSGVASLS